MLLYLIDIDKATVMSYDLKKTLMSLLVKGEEP